MAIRSTDYLPHDGSRPHLALGVDPLQDMRVLDAGDIEMPPTETELSLDRLEDAVATGLRGRCDPGDPRRRPHDRLAGHRRRAPGSSAQGRVSVVHFDAHADTGEEQWGSLYGHGTPMRRLIESGAARGDRFLQVGLRGYWPEPPTLAWMAEQGMRWFEMTEVVERGLDACLTEAEALAVDDCDGVFLSIDVDVVDPGMAPGTGTPEPGGLTVAAAARRRTAAVHCRCRSSASTWSRSRPPTTRADITAMLANRVVLEALSGIAARRAR